MVNLFSFTILKPDMVPPQLVLSYLALIPFLSTSRRFTLLAYMTLLTSGALLLNDTSLRVCLNLFLCFLLQSLFFTVALTI